MLLTTVMEDSGNKRKEITHKKLVLVLFNVLIYLRLK